MADEPESQTKEESHVDEETKTQESKSVQENLVEENSEPAKTPVETDVKENDNPKTETEINEENPEAVNEEKGTEVIEENADETKEAPDPSAKNDSVEPDTEKGVEESQTDKKEENSKCSVKDIESQKCNQIVPYEGKEETNEAVDNNEKCEDKEIESRPETEVDLSCCGEGGEEEVRESLWVKRPTESLFEEFLVLNAPNQLDRSEKEASVFKDPVLNHLAREFQIRLGHIPCAKPYPLKIRNSTEYIKVLLVPCSSFIEISRVIRCASTMNLYVRCFGNLTSFDSAIYADDYTVLVKIEKLGDTDPLCIEKLIKYDYTHEKVVRVAAGVTIKEFYNFQQKHNFNLRTDVEDSNHTVVGSIVSGRHTLITYPGRSKFATLADLVKEIRIIDCHGNMNTFKDDGQPEKQAELKYAVANLGLLGIVYDVKLSIASKTLTEVSYEYATMHALVSEPEKLMERLKNRYGLQLIYTPFNSMEFYEETGDARVWKWIADRDQVMIRAVDIVDPKSNLHKREMIKLVQETGPHYSFLDITDHTPHATKFCFNQQYITFKNSCNQELTWAIHCYEELPHDCNDLTFSLPVSENGEEVAKIFKIINNTLRSKILLTKKNFSINVCVRVSFTGATTIPLCPGKSESDGQMVAHIRLTGLRYAEDSMKLWMGITKDISKQILESVPSALPQWSTHWSHIENIDERIKLLYAPQFEELRKYLDKYDRDGMFMTIRLRRLLYPQIEGYRSSYLNRHNEMIYHLATKLFPTSFSPTFDKNQEES